MDHGLFFFFMYSTSPDDPDAMFMPCPLIHVDSVAQARLQALIRRALGVSFWFWRIGTTPVRLGELERSDMLWHATWWSMMCVKKTSTKNLVEAIPIKIHSAVFVRLKPLAIPLFKKLKASGSEALPHQEPWGRFHMCWMIWMFSWYPQILVKTWIIWFPPNFSQNQPCFPCENSLNWEPWEAWQRGARRLLSHPRWQRRFQGDAVGSVWRTGTAENLESAWLLCILLYNS